MKKRRESLLWELTHPEIEGASYVFGTMHVKSLSVVPCLDLVYQKIEHCVAFAAEFDLDDLQQAIDLSSFALPDGMILSALLPQKRYAKLKKNIYQATGIDIALMEHSQPMLISNLIDEQMINQDTDLALDQQLWQFAKSLEKKMFGIETFAAQIEILQQIPITSQVQSLWSIGRNLKQHRKNLLKMTTWYEQAAVTKLYLAVKKGLHDLRGLLLYQRNIVMARRIAEVARQQTSFCAIGIAHLPGQKGVLRLLKKDGFKVKCLIVNK